MFGDLKMVFVDVLVLLGLAGRDVFVRSSDLAAEDDFVLCHLSVDFVAESIFIRTYQCFFVLEKLVFALIILKT